eukprot:256190-Chlamydomonas_euryale.AAC.10
MAHCKAPCVLSAGRGRPAAPTQSKSTPRSLSPAAPCARDASPPAQRPSRRKCSAGGTQHPGTRPPGCRNPVAARTGRSRAIQEGAQVRAIQGDPGGSPGEGLC